MLRKYRMVSCRAPWCANQTGKNSDTVALVTILVMSL